MSLKSRPPCVIQPVDQVVAGGSYTVEILNFRSRGGPIVLTLHNGDNANTAATKLGR